MIVKFETDEPFNEYFRYMRKVMIAIISIGVLFLTAGTVSGILSIIFGASVIGIIVVLLCLSAGAFYIYTGAFGAIRKLKKNSLLVTAENKTVIFNEDELIMIISGENFATEDRIGYLHVKKIIDNDDFYSIILRNNEVIVCLKDSITEGNIALAEQMFGTVFGKSFVAKQKRGVVTAEENSDNADDNDSDGDNIVEEHIVTDSTANDKGSVNNSENFAAERPTDGDEECDV